MSIRPEKIFMFYPPGRKYQRGEDRSQGNISQSSATTMRAPNDMAYAAATLKKKGYSVFFHDFQTENLGIEDLIDEFSRIDPDAVYTSVTSPTIFDDLNIIRRLKHLKPSLAVILKGALFFNPDRGLLDQLDLTDVDYLIGGESEFIIADLMDRHFNAGTPLTEVRGILFKDDGDWRATDFTSWDEDLDGLPFPDRSIIRNELYVRPDTGEPQATIATSRGCPAACIYCLTPVISGKEVRYRSPDNIVRELRDAYHNHGIRNFFFKSDTFTIDHDWVSRLCESIINSDLYGKISWVANSRVKPLHEDTLKMMRKAGCWLIAFGFESGSQESLDLMKKGASVEDNMRAARLAKEAGLKLYGFFLIGLPWEGRPHLEATRRHMFNLNADFVEVHIAIPYPGTPLYDLARKEGLIGNTVLGTDYFNAPTRGTRHLKIDDIVSFQRKMLLQYHLRPSYVMKRLSEAIRNPKVARNYLKFGIRLVNNSLRNK